MKQYFILLKHHLAANLKKHIGSQRFLLSFVLMFLLSIPFISKAQQYVKTYKAFSPCGQTSGNLMLNCITKSKTPGNTFYVAGTQDSSIYIAEMDAMGVVLQEKLIGVKSNTYSLRSMITDDDGNIVIVGTSTAAYPFVSYIIKVSPALSLLLHRTYNNIDLSGLSQVSFCDVKDYKTSGTYYIAGGIRNADNSGGSDVLLLRLNRNTGNIVASSRYNAGEDNYDALVFEPFRGNPPVNRTIVATGRLSHGSTNTFRPWINRHNTALAFTAGARYLQDEQPDGRLYSSSLIADAIGNFNNVLYCWHGDFTTNLSVGINVGAASFNGLVPNWQKEYLITPQPQQKKFLNKIAADPRGYVTEGNWWNGSATALGGYIGEMFLIRTTKTGVPVWSRKLNNILINSVSHNASFVIDGKSIFSVGFKRNTSTPGGLQTDGVLVRIPLVDGAMDTACALVQKVAIKEYQFRKQDFVSVADLSLKDSTTYYSVNCIKTDTITNCNEPCSDTLRLDADFDLTGLIQKGNTTNYIVTASGFNGTPNSQWIVSRTTNTGSFPVVPLTTYSSILNGTWASGPTTSFGGYVGTSTVSTELNAPASVSFLVNNRYRFTHILTSTNNCGVNVSDTVIKTIHMCPGCRSIGKTGPMVETEKASSSGKIRPAINQAALIELSDVRIIPNPVKTGSFTLVYKSPVTHKFTVSIEDIQGKKVAVKTFVAPSNTTSQYSIDVSNLANGMYTVSILNGGKSITQKIVIAK